MSNTWLSGLFSALASGYTFISVSSFCDLKFYTAPPHLLHVHKRKKTENFRLGKLSKAVFSGGFLWSEIQFCYLLPKLRDKLVLRNLKNQGKRHSWSLSRQTLGYLSSMLEHATLWCPRHELLWLHWSEPHCDNVTVRGRAQWSSQPGSQQCHTLPSRVAGRLCCMQGLESGEHTHFRYNSNPSLLLPCSSKTSQWPLLWYCSQWSEFKKTLVFVFS